MMGDGKKSAKFWAPTLQGPTLRGPTLRGPPFEKAKQAAQERPLKVQLAQTDVFVERSRLRIKKVEEEREAEVELLNAALQRQARLREQVAAEPATTVISPVTTNPSEEIARLKAKVAQLEAASNHPPEAAEAVKIIAAKRRAGCVDDSLPNDEQALCEWGRFQNVGVARCHRCGEFGVSDSIDESDRSRCIQDEISNAAAVDSVQYGCFLRPAEVSIEVNREARCGHRGQRVGEAAHPGPVRRLRKVADLQNASRLGTQLTMVDSHDDRPLLRDVAPLHSPDHCGHLGCHVGEASNPDPVQTRQTRRAGTIIGDDEPLAKPCVQDTAQDRVRVRRRRRQLRALPWSWDSDTESDGPVPRQAKMSQRSFVTQVDASGGWIVARSRSNSA